MTSTTTSTSSWATSAERPPDEAGRDGQRPGPLRVSHGDPDELQADPGTGGDVFGTGEQYFGQCSPDVAATEQPDSYGRSLVGAGKGAGLVDGHPKRYKGARRTCASDRPACDEWCHRCARAGWFIEPRDTLPRGEVALSDHHRRRRAAPRSAESGLVFAYQASRSRQVVEGLPADHHPRGAAGHEEDSRAWHLVVIGGHGVPVGTRDRRGQDVAHLEGVGNVGLGDHEVAALAVLAHHAHGSPSRRRDCSAKRPRTRSRREPAEDCRSCRHRR